MHGLIRGIHLRLGLSNLGIIVALGLVEIGLSTRHTGGLLLDVAGDSNIGCGGCNLSLGETRSRFGYVCLLLNNRSLQIAQNTIAAATARPDLAR